MGEILESSEYLAENKYFKNVDLSKAFDGLTKILRREYLVDYISRLVADNVPFSMLLIDVDNFKNVNDNFGHKVGDIVLHDGAQFLVDLVKERGVVGRFGGDEFMIIVPEITDYNDVWNLCHSITFGVGGVTFKGYPSISLSYTIGVARFPLDADSYEDMFSYADKALYRGKSKGRNCFIIYLPEKHKNLFVSPKYEKTFDSMYLHARVFQTLNVTDDLKENIKIMLDTLSSYLMVDHMSVQSTTCTVAETIGNLAKYKDFEYIDGKLVDGVINHIGLFFMNKREAMEKSIHTELLDAFKKQNIKASFFCRIDCKDKIYGYLRADMSDAVRIWQNADMDLLVTAAKTIGMALYLKDSDLDNI